MALSLALRRERGLVSQPLTPISVASDALHISSHMSESERKYRDAKSPIDQCVKRRLAARGRAHGNRQRTTAAVQRAIDNWLKANADDEVEC
jgi:hypothetical protein